VSKDEFGFVFALLAEGAPDEEILERLAARAPQPVSPVGAQQRREYFERLADHLRVYIGNALDAEQIPDYEAEADEILARDRQWGRDVLPRIERLLPKIVEQF
jgi:hypothetical protein